MNKVLGLVLATVLLISCGDGSGDGDVTGGGWNAEVVFTAPDKVGGLAIGEIFEDRPGAEIACVLRTGAAYVLSRVDGKWAPEEIAQAGGEMLQCAIGDVDDRTPGSEIVIVGMQMGTEEDGGSGAVHVVSRGEEGWSREQIWAAQPSSTE